MKKNINSHPTKWLFWKIVVATSKWCELVYQAFFSYLIQDTGTMLSHSRQEYQRPASATKMLIGETINCACRQCLFRPTLLNGMLLRKQSTALQLSTDSLSHTKQHRKKRMSYLQESISEPFSSNYEAPAEFLLGTQFPIFELPCK